MRRRDAWRERLYVVIFEHDTRAGQRFDLALIACIVLSVVAVGLDTVGAVRARWGTWLGRLEWGFTLLFSLEYLLRLASARRPLLYARSFFGVVDLLSILPTYLSLLLPGSQYLLVIRVLRVLRVYRILKLVQYMSEAEMLLTALRASRRKILVFLVSVFSLAIIFGSLMYLVEGPKNGFTSLPRSIYWTIVTLTTVGYGDISPRTSLGQTLAALIMMLGYAILAVPTGIVTVELSRAHGGRGAGAQGPDARRCAGCGAGGHAGEARFCRMCGRGLDAGA